jgi:serine/threonine-protein kinase SRPK3
MNGGDVKKPAINKPKVPNSPNSPTANGNGNGGKKRRKGGDLKPIITTDGPQSAESSPVNAANSAYLRFGDLM